MTAVRLYSPRGADLQTKVQWFLALGTTTVDGCIEAPVERRFRERGSSPGYGSIFFEGRYHGAHRLAWRAVHGDIPEGLHVLHRCDNPPCLNVEHLWLGTHAENMADREAKGRTPVSGPPPATHCKRGHDLTLPGARYTNRTCAVCARENAKRWKATHPRPRR